MSSEEKVQVLFRTSPGTKAWLDSESERSGRSVQWLLEHAVQLWRNRLESDRKRRAAKAGQKR